MKLGLAGMMLALTLNAPVANAFYDLHDNGILHTRHGLLYLERGQNLDAIEEFKAAIKLNPFAGEAAPIYNDLGLAYRNVGNYPLAIASFQRACRIAPTFSMYFINLAHTYQMANQLPVAEKMIRQSLLNNSTDAEGWYLLGLIHQEQQQPAAARLCFQKYLTLQPNSFLAKAVQDALNAQNAPK